MHAYIKPITFLLRLPFENSFALNVNYNVLITRFSTISGTLSKLDRRSVWKFKVYSKSFPKFILFKKSFMILIK